MATATRTIPTEVVYPDSDGQPMADNTLQWEWVVTITGGLRALFQADPNVFVAGDLLWYPVEGRPDIRLAPDALVAFGRPKGYRGSYQQWREDGIAPQVVFEVLSPGNRVPEMVRKLRFYERYGVEEYYLYDPDAVTLDGWQREGEQLVEIPDMQGWTSPRLGIRFVLTPATLEIYGPDGAKFGTYEEVALQRTAERNRADAEQERADAEQERADAEQERADAEQERAERLAAKLRALGIDPDAV